MKTKTQTRKSKRNYLIVALVVILLLLAVGYASFSQTLNITGTASGTATWEVVFDETSTGGADAITNDGHTLTVSTTDLAYPGDAREITAVIKNNSSMPIKLTSFTPVGPSDTTNITFDYIALPTDGSEVLAANGGTCTYKFIVGWNEASTVNSISDTYSFTFDYVQDTTASTLTPSHDEH